MRSDDAVLDALEHVVSLDRFGGNNVEACVLDLAGFESGLEVCFVDHLAAARVDEDDSVLHLVEGLLAEEIGVGREKRHMDGDDVGFREQCVEVYIGSELPALVVLPFVVSDDVHAESACD